jgi:hypothetical protein
MAVTISDIFCLYYRQYIEKYTPFIPSSHLKAIQDIVACRTSVMGGELYYCENCHQFHYSYHSCKNRNCPKCQSEENDKWLDKQLEKLLPVTYYLVTFTLPSELRQLAKAYQKIIFSAMFKAAAETLQQFAKDVKYIGGEIGMTGVLHTWSRILYYHPHIHFIVPGGGYDKIRNEWNKSSSKFLFPVKALSIVFRAKLQNKIYHSACYHKIPRSVWKKEFIVHSKPVGKGKPALQYLAQYVYKIAISNNRIIKLENDMVHFYYTESSTGKKKEMKLHVFEFMKRYLQHVLPKGFQKVRYYGFLSSAAKQTFERIKLLLLGKIDSPDDNVCRKKSKIKVVRCLHCGSVMKLQEVIKRGNHDPPWEWYKKMVRKLA